MAGAIPSVFGAVQAGQHIAANAIANPGGINGAVDAYQANQAMKDATASAIPVAEEPHPREAIDDFAQHLQDHSLNDTGVPQHMAAVPGINGGAPDIQIPQTGAIPLPGAAPAAAAGQAQVPAAASGKPHSLGDEFWTANQNKIMAATRAAAKAGHNPKETFDALSSVRNQFFQSNVMKNLSAANAALMAGDNKGVETALRNAYYYFPNGSDLEIKHGADGKIMYQDPVTPTINGKDNFVEITPEHLHLIATNILDPMKVSDILTTTRAAAAKQRIDAYKAESERITANAAGTTAGARASDANSNRMLVPSRIYLNTASGANQESLAKFHNQRTILLIDQAASGAADPKLAAKMGDLAANALDNLAQGAPTTVPATTTTTNSKGQVIETPNLSPAAGRTMRDPAKVPAALRGMTPEKLAEVRGLAGTLGAANAGSMSSADAANVAVQMITGANGVHKGPNGTAEADVKIDRATNTGWLFNNATGTWRSFKLTPRVASSLAAGGSLMNDGDEGDGADADSGGFDDSHDYDNDPATRAAAK